MACSRSEEFLESSLPFQFRRFSLVPFLYHLLPGDATLDYNSQSCVLYSDVAYDNVTHFTS
jgi:hypothetical protein